VDTLAAAAVVVLLQADHLYSPEAEAEVVLAIMEVPEAKAGRAMQL
jgi:hypothetical protein